MLEVIDAKKMIGMTHPEIIKTILEEFKDNKYNNLMLFFKIVNAHQKNSESSEAIKIQELLKCFITEMEDSISHPVSSFNLGIFYRQGIALIKDHYKAYEHFKQAAAAGHTQAMVFLAGIYINGLGVEQDHESGIEWYQAAAEKGNTIAMRELGNIFLEGRVVEQDYGKAFDWFKMAAEKGSKLAMLSLARIYINGLGVEQDHERAIEWYQAAAEKGNTIAMRELGNIFLEGRVVEQDYGKAFDWFNMAAERGCIASMECLGFMYLNGCGVKKDFNEAFRLFIKPANAGRAMALRCLGAMYKTGSGVEQSWEKAIEFYTKATDAGDVISHIRLGFLYENGSGVEQSYEKAIACYTAAADKGNKEAMTNLSTIYFTAASTATTDADRTKKARLCGFWSYQAAKKDNFLTDKALEEYKTKSNSSSQKSIYQFYQYLLAKDKLSENADKIIELLKTNRHCQLIWFKEYKEYRELIANPELSETLNRIFKEWLEEALDITHKANNFTAPGEQLELVESIYQIYNLLSETTVDNEIGDKVLQLLSYQLEYFTSIREGLNKDEKLQLINLCGDIYSAQETLDNDTLTALADIISWAVELYMADLKELPTDFNSSYFNDRICADILIKELIGKGVELIFTPESKKNELAILIPCYKLAKLGIKPDAIKELIKEKLRDREAPAENLKEDKGKEPASPGVDHGFYARKSPKRKHIGNESSSGNSNNEKKSRTNNPHKAFL